MTTSLQLSATGDALPNAKGSENTSRAVVKTDRDQTTSTSSGAVFGTPQNSGILGTVETRQGGYVTREIQPTDVVRIEGTPVEVSMAERLGFLKRDASGRYVEVAQNDPSHPNAKRTAFAREASHAAKVADADGISISSEVSETLMNWSNAARGIGANPVAMLGQIVTSNGETPKVLEDMAAHYGTTNANIGQTVKGITAELRRGLGEHLQTRVGLSSAHFDGLLAFMKGRVGQAGIVSAYADLAFKGSAEVWRDYAGQYKRANGIL